jgi:hypothetical protein
MRVTVCVSFTQCTIRKDQTLHQEVVWRKPKLAQVRLATGQTGFTDMTSNAEPLYEELAAIKLSAMFCEQ